MKMIFPKRKEKHLYTSLLPEVFARVVKKPISIYRLNVSSSLSSGYLLTMEAHKLIPTDLDEILTIDRMNQGKNYGKRTRCCNSITLELFQFKMLPLIGVY